MSISTGTNATSRMKSILPRVVTPWDIADNANCKIMNIATPKLVTGTTAVTELANLANPSDRMRQTASINQGAMIADADLGRDTLAFNADRIRSYEATDPFDYTTPFSLMTVFKSDLLAAQQNLIGEESGVTSERVGLRITTNNRVRFRIGTVNLQSSVAASTTDWNIAIASYDGTGDIHLKVIGTDLLASSITVEPVQTSLRIGDNLAGYGFSGRMDMAAAFDVDLFGASGSDLLADIYEMLRQFYGDTIPNVAAL